MATAAPAPAVLHLSLVLGGALVAPDGDRLGRVRDLIVRLGRTEYPPVTGFLVTVAGRSSFLPAEQVSEVSHGCVALRQAKLDLRPFERRPDEVLLARDVLDRQLINVEGARLVRANEIELARSGGWWRVIGVDVGPRGALRRLVPKRLGGRVSVGPFLDWATIEPFTGHVPSVQLRVPHPKLAKLHPAQLADLVEAASHAQGEEIIRAVGGEDREREADVFEELEPAHQIEFIQERSDAEVAEVLSRMAPDDAADLLVELEPERVEPVLAALPAPQRRRVRALSGYEPATAGGLMSNRFVCLYEQATVAEALERVRLERIAPEALAVLYAMDTRRRLTAAVSLVDLVRADPERPMRAVAVPDPVRLVPDADLEEVARLMADFNLLVAPVVDDRQQMLGVVTVDDVLEVLLPRGWRRRFGLLGE